MVGTAVFTVVVFSRCLQSCTVVFLFCLSYLGEHGGYSGID